MKGRSDMKIKNGYHKLSLIEPLILEPEDWSAAEWATLCKICDLPVGPTQRIVLHINTMEFFEDTTQPTQDPKRTYIVTELCPHFESEVEMRWNTDTMGYKAFCPVCGKRLMLCDECHQLGGGCDYDSKTDSCQLNPSMPFADSEVSAGFVSREVSAITLRTETPLGAIIARAATDPNHPGIYIDLRRGVDDPDMPLALVEFSADDADFLDGEQNIITRVWGNARQEDYTVRTVHQNIEHYFSTEEVP